MRGALMYATPWLRRRWVSILLLTLLVGLIGAVVLTAFAGARRTASSFQRLHDETLAADLTVFIPHVDEHDLRVLRALPGVEAMARAKQLTSFVNGGFASVGGPLDAGVGRTVDKPRVVAGRRPRQDRAREIAVPETFAHAQHVGVGDEITIHGFSPAQVEELASGSSVFEPHGPKVRLRVVGITRAPSDLSIEGASGGLLITTRAFVQRYGDRIASFAPVVLRVRVADDRAASRFVRAARARFVEKGDPGAFQVQPTSETEGAIQQSIDVLTTGLVVFAAIAALSGLVVLAVALRRFIDAGAGDVPALRALGASRVERAVALALPVVVIAVVGALLAVIGAVAASPLMPLGLARDAEPDLGVDLDPVVLGVGVVAVAALVLGVGLLAAVRVVRTESSITAKTPRSSPLLGRAAAGLAPPLAVGASMALEPGRGRTAVPVRQGAAAVFVAVAGIVAVVVLSASLQELTRTPAAYGYNWDTHFDFCAQGPVGGQQQCARAKAAIAGDRAVAAAATTVTNVVNVEGHPVTGSAFPRLRGHLEPTVLEGRAPRTASEVALGADTQAAVDASIGDTVRVAGERAERRFRVVGTVVLPVYTQVGDNGDVQALADGAVLTRRGFRSISNAEDDGFGFVVRWRPGIDRAAAIERIRARAKVLGPARSAVVPLEVRRLEQVDVLPWALGAFLAVIGVLGVGYVTVVAVRRRARDLAVLKTMGFRRAQIAGTVATQATVLTVAGLVVGVPAGIILGRAVWARIADGAGLGRTNVVPALAIVAIVLLSIVVVNVCALVPGRIAARMRPATVLRSE
jgi:ABC-type antimicrobial peptide transport system permease subunit